MTFLSQIATIYLMAPDRIGPMLTSGKKAKVELAYIVDSYISPVPIAV